MKKSTTALFVAFLFLCSSALGSASTIQKAQRVLPASDPFSRGFVVNAVSRSYFFPPDTTLTTANGLLLVRAYKSLFVFRSSKVTVRQLSSPVLLSKVAPESNELLVGGILMAMPNRRLLPNDACRDCVVPVARGFLFDTSYGPQPVATPYIPSFTSSFLPSASGVTIKQSNVLLEQKLPSKNTTVPSKACFPATYVANILSGACENKVQGFQQQRIVPLAVYSLGYQYTWYRSLDYTALIAYSPSPVPAKGQRVLWNAYYYDIDETSAANGGFFPNNPHTLYGYYTAPSLTWESETEVYYYEVNYLPCGYGQGVYANIAG